MYNSESVPNVKLVVRKGDGSIFIISFCLKEINSISRSAPGRKVENRNRK